jgi:hypothetical protein
MQSERCEEHCSVRIRIDHLVPKVLACAWAHVSSEGHFDSARRATANGNVKEHNRVGHDKLAD